MEDRPVDRRTAAGGRRIDKSNDHRTDTRGPGGALHGARCAVLLVPWPRRRATALWRLRSPLALVARIVAWSRSGTPRSDPRDERAGLRNHREPGTSLLSVKFPCALWSLA